MYYNTWSPIRLLKKSYSSLRPLAVYHGLYFESHGSKAWIIHLGCSVMFLFILKSFMCSSSLAFSQWHAYRRAYVGLKTRFSNRCINFSSLCMFVIYLFWFISPWVFLMNRENSSVWVPCSISTHFILPFMDLQWSGLSLRAISKLLKVPWTSVYTCVCKYKKIKKILGPHRHCNIQERGTNELLRMNKRWSEGFNWTLRQQQKDWWKSWRH